MATNLEQCPLCGTELSQTKFREIKAKLRADDDKRADELAAAKAAMKQSLEVELRRRLDEQRRSIEKNVREEAAQLLKKAASEKEELTAKLKDSEARVTQIQSAAAMEIEKAKLVAEKKAKLEAKRESDEQLKRLQIELKGAKEREAQVREQAEVQAQKEAQKQLLDQRQAFEKDKTSALLKQQAGFNRDRDSLQKTIKMLEHQVEKKRANELGDGGEIDVFEALRDAFQGDKITRTPKGQEGADILHEVFYKGDCCGRIVTDSKNRQLWQHVFVSKLRQYKVEADAEHAILATTVFPAGKKELCIESGVIVVSPARVVYITEILRSAMITMHMKGLSFRERSNKMSHLYNLITSEAYSKKFGEAERLAQDILDLDVQEQKDHRNVWMKRGTLGTRLKNVLREVETDVASIVEADGEPQRPPFVQHTAAGVLGVSRDSRES